MDAWDVIVVGAGPAGLLAAVRAAARGRRVLVLEKNAKPAVKVLMSGGTRCNLTHATDARGIVEAFGPQGRFLHSALAALGPQGLVDLVEAEGVSTKVEPGGKVFPASDRALDVQEALVRRLRRSGAMLALGEPAVEVSRAEGGFRLATARRTLTASSVVLACGGQSYPGCGTTGDGYRFAAALGHTIVRPRPALAPVLTAAPWVPPLKGVTVSDVLVRVVADTEVLAQRRGSFLFTHFGLSGPAVLDVSRAVSGHPRPRSLRLLCDFLPAMKKTDLDAALVRAGREAGRKSLAAVLDAWLPRRLGEAILSLCGVPADRRTAELPAADRRRLVEAIRALPIAIHGTLGFEKAEVTAGGVPLDEIDSRTMASRRVPGLYVAGELLDLDGWIGGYNFQAAFSTGWLAGETA
jgi:predicted Rossmann fold flavoprotein